MDPPMKGLKILGIVVAALVVVVFALSLVADRIITSKAQAQATKLSRDWGRPVRIGGVSTKVLTGFGVRVSGVEIGAAEGEKLPLVTLERAEVKVGLLRAALSRGKDIEIGSAEIEGLTVNLVRSPDGTTNLERFQKKISPPPDAAKPADTKKSDLSFLRVDHFALLDAQVQLVDEAKGGARQLGIKHLDVKVEDLRAGKPLEVLVKAAVLGEKQNFSLQVKTSPLPETLAATPQTVALHVDPPIDLGPLGPFLGKEVGLQKGTFDADFDMQLGAAVPGGEGPTTVKGIVKLAGLRFAGAQGGKDLDVTLDTDLKGDANAGDVQIGKLQLDVGPAGIRGHGSAKGLNSPSPRIEGLEITGHDLDPDKLAAYYPPIRKSLGNMLSGPIGLDVRASGTQAAQSLQLKLDLTPVRMHVPQSLTKAAGAPMTFIAHVHGAAASGGPIRFDAKADLTGVDLRPGDAVDKAPGQRLDFAIEGTRSANKSSTDPQQRIEIADVKAHVLEDEIEGKGFFESKGAGAKATRKFELQLASSRLDLDKLLLPSKTKEKKKPLDPKAFAGLSGHATVKIDLLRQKKQEMRDVIADVTVVEDYVKVTKAGLKAFGGTVDASGSELKLAHPKEPFKVALKIQNVEMANALGLLSEKKIITGKFDGAIDLRGGGQEMADLARTLAGVIDGKLQDGTFLGKDLIGAVTGPLVRALPAQLAGKVTEGGRTDLGKELPFGLTVENGTAKLKQPIRITRPEAEMSFTGGIRVDGNLDLPGTIALSPATISAITGGKVKPSAAIPVKVHLQGPAWSPSIADLDLKPAVEQILKQAGTALLGKALGVDNVEEKKQQIQGQATAKADEEAKKARERAAAEADAQKKRVEDEAQKRLKGLFGR